jgi:hypothetical protein
MDLCEFFKERKMTGDNSSSQTESNQRLNWNQVAELTGFPIDFLKKELLIDENSLKEDFSVDELRNIMLKLIDQEFFTK